MGLSRRDSSTGADGEVDSVVTRAFRFAHDPSATQNSGGDRHNTDDYCCGLVEAPTTLIEQLIQV